MAAPGPVKRILKAVGRARVTRVLLGRLASLYLRLVLATCRRDENGFEAVRDLAMGGGVLGAVWHGRVLLMLPAWRGRGRATVLISGHRDGRLVAGVVERLGYPVITGSSRRGGVAAAREILSVLQEGMPVAMAPDGPRGPRMHAKEGIIGLARLSGVPILPLGLACRPAIQFKSWDRFVLPLPFARIAVRWGDPIAVPPGADEVEREGLRQILEQRLRVLTREADLAAGRVPVEPAAPLAQSVPAAGR